MTSVDGPADGDSDITVFNPPDQQPDYQTDEEDSPESPDPSV